MTNTVEVTKLELYDSLNKLVEAVELISSFIYFADFVNDTIAEKYDKAVIVANDILNKYESDK